MVKPGVGPGVRRLGRMPVVGLLLAGLLLAGAGPIGAESCTACHVKGVSGMGQLQGKPAEDLQRMMEAYRNGALPNTLMGRIVKGFTPEEVRSLAGWFSRQ